MKSLKYLLYSITLLFFISCDKEDASSGKAKFAVPIIKSLSEIRNSVSIGSAKQTNSDGKIYVAENYLFYIAKEQGVHIYNNQNPATPSNIAFINIPGVHDISVKGNYLYADNYVDLLVFDISNINAITLVKTVENSMYFNPVYPSDAAYYDYTINPETDELIVGFTIEMRSIPNEQYILASEDASGNFESTSSSGNGVGVGGSYAKFQINNNALYAINSYKLNVFNISVPENTFFDKDVYMNTWFSGEFETLFIQKQTLFVGATTGMYTVDASDEFNPVFVGSFSHATSCDPVVVFGDLAYITVRGGNFCGAIDDQINVINVADIENPTLISTTLVNQPYGLGIKDDTLYVCCGNDGIKVFDATNSSNLVLQNTYLSTNMKDVIPLNSHLIAVGTNKIIQYNYGPNFTLIPISEITF